MLGDPGFGRLVEVWLPLSWSLNMINRSMGHRDLYPFVLPAAVLQKMRFIHNLVQPGDTGQGFPATMPLGDL